MEATTTNRARDRESKIEAGALLTSIFIIAVCGLIYELIIGTLLSYLLGDSIFQFSITIGFFLTAMGIGFTLLCTCGGIGGRQPFTPCRRRLGTARHGVSSPSRSRV